MVRFTFNDAIGQSSADTKEGRRIHNIHETQKSIASTRYRWSETTKQCARKSKWVMSIIWQYNELVVLIGFLSFLFSSTIGTSTNQLWTGQWHQKRVQFRIGYHRYRWRTCVHWKYSISTTNSGRSKSSTKSEDQIDGTLQFENSLSIGFYKDYQHTFLHTLLHI